jgi:hypothetical protein
VSRPALEALLRVELGARYAGRSRQETVHVELTCDPEVVSIDARFPDGERRERQMSPSEVRGEVGARTLALAIGELVRPEALLVEPVDASEPEDAPFDSTPQGPKEERVRLSVGGSLMSHRFDRPLLLGAVLGATLKPTPWLRLRLDGLVLGATERTELGEVETTLGAASAQLGTGVTTEGWDLEAFLGYRLGEARITGHPREAEAPLPPANAGSIRGTFAGPVATLALARDLTGPLRLVLGFEAGWVVAPVRGRVDGGGDVLLDEAWTRLELGLALAL